jgi:hypothetical protein
MPAPKPPQTDLTIRDVAELTQQSVYTVSELVRKGRFQGAYKAGSGGRNSPVRILPAALEYYRATQPLAGG